MSKKKNTNTAPAAPTAPAPETAAPAPEHGSVVVPVLRKQATRALWAALGTNPGSTAAALADTAGIAVSTARRLLTGWESARAVRSYTDPETPLAAKTWFTAGSAAPVAVEPEPAAPEPINPQPGPAGPAAPEPVTPEPDSAEPDSAEPASVGPAEPEPTAPEPVSLEPATPDPADPAEAEPADPAPDNARETAAAAPTADDPATPAPVAPVPVTEPADAESTVERLPAGALRGQVEDYLRDNPGEEFSPHQIGKALDRSSGAVHNALVKLAKDGTARQTGTAPKKFTLAS